LQEGQTYHYVITWTVSGEESAPSRVASATPWYMEVPTHYRITYYGNGQTAGLAPVDSVSYSTGDQAAILAAASSFTRSGFEFVAWNTDEKGTGTDFTPGQQIEIGTTNLNLFAKWRELSYKVTYIGNNNTAGLVPEQSSYSVGAQVTVSDNSGGLQRTGFTFAGWNTAADGSGTSYQAGQSFVMGTSDITLHALWKSLSVVTYDGNQNTAGVAPADSTTYNAGDVVTLLDSGSLAREGYVFAGWNTSADGTGTTYAAGTKINMPAEGLKLYARWRSTAKFTVNFLGNGSDGGTVPAPLSHMQDEIVTLPGNTGNLTNGGKTFFGWNTAADGSGREYSPGDTFVMTAADVSLYAQWQEFAGGDGSSASPYLVANPEQLNRVRNHPEASFRQISDIDLSNSIYNTGNGWVPIGSSTIAWPSLKFKGTYDGDGKKIANLFIKSEGEEYVGLFGSVDGAVIKNLTIETADVTGKNSVGILAGSVSNGKISNCHSSGRVKCVSARSGGLLGYGMSVIIEDSSSSATVSGLTFQGGLIGDVSTSLTLSSITNCNTSGSVIGSYTVGGLVGNIDGKSSLSATVVNSYATGDVSGDNHSLGGLIGSNGGYVEVRSCYATGKVTALPRNDGYAVSNVGGLVGMNYGHISSSYATGNISGGFQTGGLAGHSESGSITRCYANGSVITESDRAGGLVGLNYCNIEDSYATGSVSGKNNVGGLLGRFHTGAVSRCYAAGLVKGGNYQPYIGGLCGFADGTIAASYWDSGTTGQTTSSGGGSPLTTSQMKQQQSFSGWDFSTVWAILADSYPTLR
ncbi:MAG: InlB B-repeat-containing protein, partial [Candidatus Riflebacteria bacterium]|nr:InlB B-repeat-containing protein [Candidatus Riflebacteria bacterium]